MYVTVMAPPVSLRLQTWSWEDVEDFMILCHFLRDLLMLVYTSLLTDKVQHFLSLLNSIETTIKFTYEVETENRISFLDADIMHHSDSSLSTTVYHKKTHTEKYLAYYDSHHPTAHKIYVAKTLFTRAENICTTNIRKEENENTFKECAKSNWLSTPYNH